MQNHSQIDSKRAISFAIAGAVALACAAIYFALRPPLYDFDGYLYRLGAVSPQRFGAAMPEHLIWFLIEILMAQVAGVFGWSASTLPVQVVGIVLNCIALFLFCALLMRTSGSAVYAVAATLFVGFSPKFWYVGFQNGPYPALLLAIVGYFWMWVTEDGEPPSGYRLFLAAVFITFAVLVHEAAVFLVLAGVIVLALYGKGPVASRMTKAVAWGAGIAAIVLPAYVTVWALTDPDNPFFRWTANYVESIHAIQFQFPAALAKITMGVTGAIIQSGGIQAYLESQSTPGAVLAIYESIGFAIVVAVAILVWWAGLRRQMSDCIRGSALFTMSLLSLLLWSAFVIVWEPASPHYWLATLFPALIVIGLLFRSLGQHGVWAFASLAILLCGWNLYFDHQFDRQLSRTYPPPLVAEIRKYVGDRDIFIVLDQDTFANINYELLFDVLAFEGRNPCVPIVEDFVTPAGSSDWKDKLRAKIDQTLNSGGRVYVANHVLESDSYNDLAGKNDAFSPYIDASKASLNGPALYQDIQRVVDDYDQEATGFALGDDHYVELKKND